MTKPLPTYFMGIDPGLHTGVSLYNTETNEINGFEYDYDIFGTQAEVLMSTLRPAVGCEAFVITSQTARNSAATWSLRNIGVVEFLSRKYGLHCVIQAQAASKRFGTDKRLHSLGWYVPGKGHLNDAHRQTLLLLVAYGWWSDKLKPSS